MSWPSLLPARAPARLLSPVVGGLVALHVTPVMLTVAGLAGNVVAAAAIWRGALLAGGLIMLAASALDMLDGAVARATGTASPFGALFDSVLDRVSEAAVLFGILLYALERGSDEQAALAFIAVVASLMVSYTRARSEGLGLALTDGFFRRQERVVLIAAALVFGLLRPGLWVLAVLSTLTAIQRVTLAARALRARDAAATPDATQEMEDRSP